MKANRNVSASIGYLAFGIAALIAVNVAGPFLLNTFQEECTKQNLPFCSYAPSTAPATMVATLPPSTMSLEKLFSKVDEEKARVEHASDIGMNTQK